MLVGICYTKRTKHIIKLLDKFAIGVEKSGDTAVKLQCLDAIFEFVRKCDTLVMFGWHKTYGEQNLSQKLILRYKIAEECRKHRKRILVIDTCFFNDHAKWHAIGFDGIKGEAKFYNENSPFDRWLNHNIEIKPWRKIGKHILVIGQNRFNVSAPDIDFWKWHLDICCQIHKETILPIVFRPHTSLKVKEDYTCFPDWIKISKGQTLQYDLESCWTAIGYTSNALVECLIQGIPIICLSPNHILYNHSNNHIKFLHNPQYSKREQILYDLAYAQWHISEIHSGQAWQHLRQFVYA